MESSAAARANATAKCPGSFQSALTWGTREAARKGLVQFGCRQCAFTWESEQQEGVTVVAPWHRAVR